MELQRKKVKLSPPWIELEHKLTALFGKDPEIKIVTSGDDADVHSIKLLVSNTDKAAALEKILPTQKTYGSITVHIIVVPANSLEESESSMYRTAFKGNPVVKDVIDSDRLFSMTYVMFAPKVIQYYNDNLGDPNGNKTTLLQTIADEIFEEHDGVYFCTDNCLSGYSF